MGDDIDYAEHAVSSSLANALRTPTSARAAAMIAVSSSLSSLRASLAFAALPDQDALSRHARQLADFEATEARLKEETVAATVSFDVATEAELDAEESFVVENDANNVGDGVRNSAEQVRHRQLPERSVPKAPPAANGALHRTHAVIVGEVDRIAALGELLSADSAALARADSDYSALEGEISEARERLQAIRVRIFGTAAATAAAAANAVSITSEI